MMQLLELDSGTERRLGATVSVKWIGGRELKSVKVKRQADGSGDLVFERHLTGSERRAQGDLHTVFHEGGPIRGPDQLIEGVLDDPTTETFVGVRDVTAVFDLLRRTFGLPTEAPRGPSSP